MQPDAKTIAFEAATGSYRFVVGDEEANGIEEIIYFTSNRRIIAGRENGLVCGGVETSVRRIVPN